MKVHQVAHQLGLNTQTIYYYERIGLIPSPNRNVSGYRLFSDQDVERLTWISRAKALGLTLEEIREILELREDQSLTCETVHQRLMSKVNKIDTAIAQLQNLKGELLTLTQRCEHTLKHQQRDTDCGVFSGDCQQGQSSLTE